MSTITTEEAQAGLQARYYVRKISDPTGQHDDCRYFVLDPEHDPIALEVLSYYIEFARRDGYEALADDLSDWRIDIRVRQHASGTTGRD